MQDKVATDEITPFIRATHSHKEVRRVHASYHDAKTLLQDPVHAHSNANGVVKTSKLKLNKEGHGSKGAWGSSKDDIEDARDLVHDLPPAASPEREKSMRKVSLCTIATDTALSLRLAYHAA